MFPSQKYAHLWALYYSKNYSLFQAHVQVGCFAVFFKSFRAVLLFTFLSSFRFDIFIALLPRKHWQMSQNHFFFLLVLITHPPPWRLPVRCTDSEFLLWSLYQGKYLLWPGNLVSQDQWPPRSVMICNDLLRATVFANNVVDRLGFDSAPLIDIILQDDKEFTESTECDQNPLVNCLYLQVVFLDGGSSDSLAASWLKFSTCSEY